MAFLTAATLSVAACSGPDRASAPDLCSAGRLALDGEGRLGVLSAGGRLYREDHDGGYRVLATSATEFVFQPSGGLIYSSVDEGVVFVGARGARRLAHPDPVDGSVLWLWAASPEDGPWPLLHQSDDAELFMPPDGGPEILVSRSRTRHLTRLEAAGQGRLRQSPRLDLPVSGAAFPLPGEDGVLIVSASEDVYRFVIHDAGGAHEIAAWPSTPEAWLGQAGWNGWPARHEGRSGILLSGGYPSDGTVRPLIFASRSGLSVIMPRSGRPVSLPVVTAGRELAGLLSLDLPARVEGLAEGSGFDALSDWISQTGFQLARLSAARADGPYLLTGFAQGHKRIVRVTHEDGAIREERLAQCRPRAPVSEVRTVTPEGQTLTHYRLAPEPSAASRDLDGVVVVHVHGGPSARAYPELPWFFERLVSQGALGYGANYRGNTGFTREIEGLAEPLWTVGHMVEDVRAVLDQARRDNPGRPVILLGDSFGAYLILQLLIAGGGADIDGVVLFASFPGYEAGMAAIEGQWDVPVLEAFELRRDALSDGFWAALETAPLDQLPVVFVHGTADTVTSWLSAFSMAQRLDANPGACMTWRTVTDAGHGDIPSGAILEAVIIAAKGCE
ncbi:alpha/beta hydrolase [Alkalicaulis satelles]|nr:alpha/beta hydrolase [Alkalicaulis satelles]